MCHISRLSFYFLPCFAVRLWWLRCDTGIESLNLAVNGLVPLAKRPMNSSGWHPSPWFMTYVAMNKNLNIAVYSASLSIFSAIFMSRLICNFLDIVGRTLYCTGQSLMGLILSNVYMNKHLAVSEYIQKLDTWLPKYLISEGVIQLGWNCKSKRLSNSKGKTSAN